MRVVACLVGATLGLTGLTQSAAFAANPATGGSMLVETATAQPASGPIALLPWRTARARPVLRPGSRSVWVKRTKVALAVPATGPRFGAQLGVAVRVFRASHRLSAKPVVNARVWRLLGPSVITKTPPAPAPPPAPTSAPTPAPTSDERPALRKGDSSSWVKSVQHALGVQPESGYFGTVTDAAVRAFQTSVGLTPTGIVDTATWNALGTRVAEPAIDITTTELARTSATHRATIGVAAFVSSATALIVLERESGGSCTAVSSNGMYRGRWQMDRDFWSSHGGTEFAARPDLATCAEQDQVAYNGWVERWWQPWPTSN